MELRARSRTAWRRPGFYSGNRAGFRGGPHRGTTAHRKFLFARRETRPAGSFASTGAAGCASGEKDLMMNRHTKAHLECTTDTSGAAPSPLNGERVGVRGENLEATHRLTRLFQLAHPSPLIPLPV